jgi:CBS domain-containing protein
MEPEVSSMRVKELMSTPVVCVSPTTPLKQVASILVERGISAVPVVGDDGWLVGIVSEADLVRLEMSEDPRRHLLPTGETPPKVRMQADEVMTRDVIALPEDADAAEAARLMVERRVKRIPIVSGARVVGILSRRDLLRTMVREDSEIKADVDALIGDQAFMVGRFDVIVRGGEVVLDGGGSPSERRLAELLARSVPGVLGVRFEFGAEVGAKG